jgi:hypothetical protein
MKGSEAEKWNTEVERISRKQQPSIVPLMACHPVCFY